MNGSFPAFACPRCRGPLEDLERAYRCRACGSDYPIVAGIPDFRVFPDPWLGLEADREKARRVADRTRDATFEEAVRTYWQMTPSTPPDRARRFAAHALRARGRSEEWLDLVAPPVEAQGAWLDLGTGTADLAAAGAARGASVVGVDIALRWLAVARRRPGVREGRVRLVCACAEALPFPPASFDRVLSLGLLAHASNPEAVSSEAHRVLRPGGRIRLRTVNRFSLAPEPHVGIWGVDFLPRTWADRYVQWRTGEGYGRHRPLSPREVRRGLEGAGFQDVGVDSAPTLSAEVAGLGSGGRALAPLYEAVRDLPGLGTMARWTAPLLEAEGTRP